MSRRAPPPGALVASGHVRVDAARALVKLRAYRLANPADWILEAIRAAVGSGATAIELDGDADDVWLRWWGPAWSADSFLHVLDDLVSPEASDQVYPRRLLGSAINSALGLGPAWIDLVAVEGERASAVRFALGRPDGAASANSGDELRPLEAAPAPAPPAGQDGQRPAVVLHLRRRASLATLGRFLFGAEPPEISAARSACEDVAAPMTICGRAVGRDAGSSDLLRLSLGQGRSFIAVVTPAASLAQQPPARLQVAELGVRVVSEEWREARIDAVQRISGIGLPVRLLIDADRVPTNAARSQVDESAHLVRIAKARGAALLPELVAQLVTAGLGADELDRARLREAALALLASAIGGDAWATDVYRLASPLLELAQAPLLRNAVGQWRPVQALWLRPVYRGRKPLPAELAPWLDTLAWMPPGDSAERLLAGANGHAQAARELVRHARRAKAVRDRFFEQPVVPARVTAHPGQLFARVLGDSTKASSEAPSAASSAVPSAAPTMAPSAVPAAWLTDVTGEVCLIEGWQTARLALLHHGRLLETVLLDTPLPFDAVLDSAQVSPDVACRAAERDPAWEHVARAARGAAVQAVEALCVRTGADGWSLAADSLRALVRAAQSSMRSLGVSLHTNSTLAQAPVWPTLSGGWVSIAELRVARGVAVVEPEQPMLAPRGRRVVVASELERSVLTGLLAATTQVVAYRPFNVQPAIDPGLALARRLIGQHHGAALVVRESGRSGAICIAASGSVSLHHRGAFLGERARKPALVPCAIAVDSEGLLPDASWQAALEGEDAALDGLAAWEHQLFLAAAQALLGDVSANLQVSNKLSLKVKPRLLWCAVLAPLAPQQLEQVLGAQLLSRLRQQPLFRLVGKAERVSAEQVAAAFGARPIAMISPVEGTVWEAVGQGALLLAERDEARLAGLLAGLPVIDGTPELSRRRREAQRASLLAAHRQKPRVPVQLPLESFAVALPPWLGSGVIGAPLTPLAGGMEVTVLVEERVVLWFSLPQELPLVAVLELSPANFTDDWSAVAEPARGRMISHLQTAAQRWLLTLVRANPVALVETPTCRLALHAWVRRQRFFAARAPGLFAQPRRAASLPGVPGMLESLRQMAAWRSLRGERVSLAAAEHGGQVRVARWSAPWLGPADGEAAHSLDGTVLALTDHAGGSESCHELIEELSPELTLDVTDEVARLQARRREALQR
ncbi:MAG TPA: hypothetical protein PKU97_07965, partial [Kofleriaceae bacterium]|nr:hypothetical protein [Kofleriaceae bacterium]